MKTIWKFALQITDVQTVTMPQGAVVLPTVVAGDDWLTIWAMVDPQALTAQCTFYVVGTGNPMPSGEVLGEYIGTGLQSFFVWHVFSDSRNHRVPVQVSAE